MPSKPPPQNMIEEPHTPPWALLYSKVISYDFFFNISYFNLKLYSNFLFRGLLIKGEF